MSFMMKKKRFKFQLNFEVEELASVPFVNGVLFAKVRLLDGGSFTELTTREEVWEHKVRWRAKMSFICKMTASATSGILEPCVCRVSIRKEVKGGRSFQKLGFADINLAEFAGAGATTRRYLLEGYDSKRRQDNSTLKVNIDMALLSGDPCFKVPRIEHQKLPGEPQNDVDLQPENKGAGGGDEFSEDSMASGSSGFGSLPRGKQRTSLVTSGTTSTIEEPSQNVSILPPSQPGAATSVPTTTAILTPNLGGSDPEFKRQQELQAEKDKDKKETEEIGHCRNHSCGSQLSKASGYSSSHTGTHSRQSSYGSATGHTRSPSAGSCMSDKFGSLRTKKEKGGMILERRVDTTRIDNDELIDELIQNTDFLMDDSAETSGLQLFIAKDGTTALSSQQIRNQPQRGKFEQVIIEKR